MKALHIITGLGVGGAEQQLRLLLRHLPVDCDVVTLTNPGAGRRRAHRRRRPRHPPRHDAATATCARCPGWCRLIRARPLRPRAHPPLPGLRVRHGSPRGWRGCGRSWPPSTRSATRQMEGRPLTAGRPRAVPGQRAARPRAPSPSPPTVADRLRALGGARAAHPRRAQRHRRRPASASTRRRAQRTRRRLGLPDDAFVVGGVGRLAAGKRFDVLVRALAAAARRLPAAARRRRPRGDTCCGAPRTSRAWPTGSCSPANGPPSGRPARPRSAVADRRHGRARLAQPPRRRSGSPSWRRWPPDCRCCYASCPALEDLPPEAAARRRAGSAAARTRSPAPSTGVRAAGPAGRPAAEAAHHYCITRSAAQLMDVYAAAVSRTSDRSDVPP